jgi:predicted nuclease of predicted toxin-antitoxin system
VIRFVCDEQLPTAVFRAARAAGLDVVRVQDLGLRSASDPDLLAWAAADGRVVLTLDRDTLPDFAYARVRAGLPMPGVVVPRADLSAGAVVVELLLTVGAGTPDDLRNQVVYLPY